MDNIRVLLLPLRFTADPQAVGLFTLSEFAMKRKLYGLVLVILFSTCLSLFFGKGYFTYKLMSSSTLVDPPVERFNNAFLSGNKIILDYTVGVGNGVGRSYGPPGDYWCEFKIDKSFRKNSKVLESVVSQR